MKKQIPKILICCLCLPLLVRAQVAPEVLKKFSAYTVSNVYRVVSRVDLPTDKQLLLANFFENQNSLATAGLTANEPAEKISAYYLWGSSNLQPILTRLELNDYTASNPISFGVSKFQFALKFRDDLKLTDAQQNQLFDIENKLKAFKTTAGFKQDLYEVNQLSKVLDQTQQQKFAEFYAKHKALHNADFDWDNLIKYHLVKKADSVNTAKTLYAYHFKRIATPEILRMEGKNYDAEQLNKRTEIEKPFLLYQLDLAKGSLPSCKLNDVLKLKKEVKLEPVQIDSLLQNVAILKARKLDFVTKNPSKNTEERSFQNQVIAKTLTPQQMSVYLFFKNKDLAKNNAKANWEMLKEKKMTSDADSAATVKSFIEYELKYMAADDHYQMDKSKANAFRKNSVATNKPQLLKDLEAITQNTTNQNKLKSQFAW